MVERRPEQAAEVVERRPELAAEVVERRLEQAAEESSGLFKTLPQSGNDNHNNDKRTRHSAKPAIPSPPGLSLLDSSAACSRRRSTTYIPVGEPSLE